MLRARAAKVQTLTTGTTGSLNRLMALWTNCSVVTKSMTEMLVAARVSNLRCPYGWVRSGGREAK